MLPFFFPVVFDFILFYLILFHFIFLSGYIKILFIIIITYSNLFLNCIFNFFFPSPHIVFSRLRIILILDFSSVGTCLFSLIF